MTEQQAFAELVAAGLTTEAIAAAYAFGAGSVVTWWFMAFVIAAARKAIGMT